MPHVPLVQLLFDAQAGSVRPGVERAMFSGLVEVAGVTRRYAALTASCLTLLADQEADDGAANNGGREGGCVIICVGSQVERRGGRRCVWSCIVYCAGI